MHNRASVKKLKEQSRGRATERGGGPKECGVVFGVRVVDMGLNGHARKHRQAGNKRRRKR